MVENGTLSSLATTQRDIVQLLKFNVEMGTEDLARELFITAGAVRHHLALLSRAGYVTYRQEGERRGRPRFIYRLTDEGHALFPTAYEALALKLLKAVREEAPQVLQRVLEEGAQERLEHATGDEDAPATGCAAALLGPFERDGFMPRVEGESGSVRLTMHHCPILEAARTAPEFCEAELQLLRKAAGPNVARMEWRLEGSELCSYLIAACKPPAEQNEY